MNSSLAHEFKSSLGYIVPSCVLDYLFIIIIMINNITINNVRNKRKNKSEKNCSYRLLVNVK